MPGAKLIFGNSLLTKSQSPSVRIEQMMKERNV